MKLSERIAKAAKLIFMNEDGKGIVKPASTISMLNLKTLMARDSGGTPHNVTIPNQFDMIDPKIANEIYMRCHYVFAVVSKTASAVSAIEFKVKSKKNNYDKVESDLRCYKDLFDENIGYATNPDYHDQYKSLGICMRALSAIKEELPTIIYDRDAHSIPNFEKELFRKSRELKNKSLDEIAAIESFVFNPNNDYTWTDLVKIYVQDLMIHRAAALYFVNNNIYALPGGSVYKVMGRSIGESYGYVQLGDFTEPLFMHPNEVIYSQYMPNSNFGFGMSPLDALIDSITSTMLFDKLMANYADQDLPPEKLLVVTTDTPGFDPSAILAGDPMSKGEQKRIETVLNRAKKENAIKLITGLVGTPMVLDISKTDVAPLLLQFDELVKQRVAMVYNQSNMIVNMTDTSGTSGRSTAEVMERNDNSKGIRPYLMNIENIWTYKVIPRQFSSDYMLESVEEISEAERMDIIQKKVTTGLFSKNALREELGLYPVDGGDNLTEPLPQQQTNDILASIANKL